MSTMPTSPFSPDRGPSAPDTTRELDRRGRVTVVGSINMDLVVRTPRMARPGETLAGQGFAQIPGGKGANQAVAAARLGAHVHMVGCLGQDHFGTLLRQALEDEGIQCDGVGIAADLPSGIAVILVDERGQNAITVVAGSNGALSPIALANHHAMLDLADVVVCQMEVPSETVHAALAHARAAEKVVILNPAPVIDALPAGWLPLIDFLIPNETEAESLTGIRVDSLEGATAAARQLRRDGARHVLITLGARGVLWLPEGSDAASHHAGHRVEAKDTTAAGDTFVGALAAALAAGDTAATAIRFGLAAAALSVTRAGAQTSIPTHAEVIAFMGSTA
ncbi:ribokinase [Robbsia sp. KACC 23696]|uniref:ribokinase n=1 Tax=Robbsia sp. KACC 23696 TaxID=3149231 RepID=UPI00325B554B